MYGGGRSGTNFPSSSAPETLGIRGGAFDDELSPFDGWGDGGRSVWSELPSGIPGEQGQSAFLRPWAEPDGIYGSSWSETGGPSGLRQGEQTAHREAEKNGGVRPSAFAFVNRRREASHTGTPLATASARECSGARREHSGSSPPPPSALLHAPSAVARYARLRERLAKIHDRQSALLDQRGSVLSLIRSHGEEAERLAAAQAEALSREDFAAAERLDAAIARENAGARDLRGRVVKDLERAFPSLADNELWTWKEIGTWARNAEAEMADGFEIRVLHQRQAVEREEGVLKREEKRYEEQKRQLEDRKIALENENRLYEAVERQALTKFEAENKDIIDERRAVVGRCLHLKEEIEETLRRLESLQREEAEEINTLSRIDRKIIDIEASYADERKEVAAAKSKKARNEKKLSQIEQGLISVSQIHEAQRHRLELSRKSLDEVSAERDTKIEQIRRDIAATTGPVRPGENGITNENGSAFEQFWIRRMNDSKEIQKIEKAYQSLEADYEREGRTAREYSAALATIRRELAERRKLITLLEAELSGVEEAKALAIKAGDFQQAEEMKVRQLQAKVELDRVRQAVAEGQQEANISQRDQDISEKERERKSDALERKWTEIENAELSMLCSAVAWRKTDLQLLDNTADSRLRCFLELDLKALEIQLEINRKQFRRPQALRSSSARASGQHLTPAVSGSGPANGEVTGSGPANGEVTGSGPANGEVTGSGSANGEVTGSGPANREVTGRAGTAAEAASLPPLSYSATSGTQEDGELLTKAGSKLKDLEEQLGLAVANGGPEEVARIEESIKRWQAVLKNWETERSET